MVTSIEEIRRAAETEVELSGWQEGMPFRCRLRKPSLYQMMANGNIPNPLLPTIERLFTATVPKEMTAEDKQLEGQALLRIAAAALVEPKAAELVEAGIELTDTQILEIYAYVISGPKGLDSFRRGTRRPAGGDDAGDARAAERPAGH